MAVHPLRRDMPRASARMHDLQLQGPAARRRQEVGSTGLWQWASLVLALACVAAAAEEAGASMGLPVLRIPRELPLQDAMPWMQCSTPGGCERPEWQAQGTRRADSHLRPYGPAGGGQGAGRPVGGRTSRAPAEGRRGRPHEAGRARRHRVHRRECRQRRGGEGAATEDRGGGRWTRPSRPWRV